MVRIPRASASWHPNNGPAPPNGSSAMPRGSSPRATLPRLSARALPAAAAGAHRLDQDGGQREGKAGDRSAAVAERGPAGHEARVGTRATHVERQQVPETYRRADQPGTNHASRGAGERERRRPRRRRRRGKRPAARGHHAEHPDPAGPDFRLEPSEISGDLGTEIRFDGGRAAPLELPE